MAHGLIQIIGNEQLADESKVYYHAVLIKKQRFNDGLLALKR